MTDETSKAVIIETEEERKARLHITDAAELLHNHATDLKNKGKFYAAKIAAQRAIALCPDAHILYNLLGAVQWNLGEYEASKRSLDIAYGSYPDDFAICCNYASLMSSFHDYAKSEELFDRAIGLATEKKQNEHARWDRCMMLLDSGQWEKGLKDYDVRIQYRGSPYYTKMPYPYWAGEDLTDKTILVNCEQGIGDRILLSRYLIWIKGKWPSCRILFVASTHGLPSLENIMWEYNNFLEFLPIGIPWPKADYGVYLGSLPNIHGTTLDNVPPDPGLIKMRAQHDAKDLCLGEPHVKCLKIGVCWTGNSLMQRNTDRTIPVELLLELETLPFVQLYGLQFGEGHDDIARLGAHELIADLAPDIEREGSGLVGTAAAMTKMDLVISVCTLNAHLAGAVGVPTWVLLCHDPYWVWVRERSDSVWWPTLRLFRQPQPNDWRSVIDEVKVELVKLWEQKQEKEKNDKLSQLIAA